MSGIVGAKGKAIEVFMENASVALAATNYFEAENNCVRALELSRRGNDFDRMARILLPLQEARRQRRQAACDVPNLRIIDEIPEVIEPGRYLLEPPAVGIFGREMGELAFRQRVAAMILVREPTTRMGKWPIVGVGTGPREPVVVRVQIEPPHDLNDLSWYMAAHEALGDAAIRKAPANVPPDHHVDDLLDYLAAAPDHEKLIQAVREACEIAAKSPISPVPRRRPMMEDAHSF